MLFSENKLQNWATNQQGIVKNVKFLGEDLVIEKNAYNTQFPQFTLIFDAEWAGVHWITGQPKISCPSDDSFFSGESKTLEFTISNIAEEKGAFSLSLDCKGLSSNLDKNKILLDSGGSDKVRGMVTTSSQEGETAKCYFKAFATREPSKSDQCSFEVDVKKVEKTQLTNSNGTSITGFAVNSAGESEFSAGWLILGVMVLLIVGVIGVYFYRNRNVSVPLENKDNLSGISTAGHCSKCGNLLKSESSFCTTCGKKVFKK